MVWRKEDYSKWDLTVNTLPVFEEWKQSIRSLTNHSFLCNSKVFVDLKEYENSVKVANENVYQQHVHYFVETYLNEWYQYKHCPESTDRETQLTESSSSSVGSWYKKKHVKIIIQFKKQGSKEINTDLRTRSFTTTENKHTSVKLCHITLACTKIWVFV